MRKRGTWRPVLGVAVLAALALCAAPAAAIITTPYFGQDPAYPDDPSKIIQVAPYPQIVNILVGADRFYDAGYYGFNTILTNVEGGYVWDGHEATSQRGVAAWIADPSLTFTSPQYDFHATAVGFTMAGLGPPAPDGGGYYWHQFGMAPGAALVSAAIATDWPDHSGAFNTSNRSFTYAYQTAMAGIGAYNLFAPNSGITPGGIIKSDVINSSWGFSADPNDPTSNDPAGVAYETRAIDALAYANHNTVCLAAGNDGTAVGGPASGYNAIAVAALTSDTSTPPYGQAAGFSNRGPNDFYNPVTGVTLKGVRPGVDIAAPGSNLYLATYVGQSGTNTDGHLWDNSGLTPAELQQYAAQLYLPAAAGTSFASPIVAGGAALLVDAGYARFNTPEAVDGRVIKAVLLNSARKTPGWDNQQRPVGGVVTTTLSLDPNVGAGALDLNRGFDQYLSGTTDLPGLAGGTIETVGWDFGRVARDPLTLVGGHNDYLFRQRLPAGQQLVVTLDWFINRSLDASDLDHPVAADVSFDQLNLEIWGLDANQQLTTLLAMALGAYNNVDHLYFTLPEEGGYAIRVTWGGNLYDVAGNTPYVDDYGLAWFVVPEPGSGLLLVVSVMPLLLRRGRRS